MRKSSSASSEHARKGSWRKLFTARRALQSKALRIIQSRNSNSPILCPLYRYGMFRSARIASATALAYTRGRRFSPAGRRRVRHAVNDKHHSGPAAIPFPTLSTPALRLLDSNAQGCPHFLVEHEAVLGAFALRGELRPAMQPVHRTVERPMGRAQAGRRQIGVVKVRKRRVRIGGASVEDGLGRRPKLFDVGPAGGQSEQDAPKARQPSRGEPRAIIPVRGAPAVPCVGS